MRAWARAKSLLQWVSDARHRRRVVAGSMALLALTLVAIFVSRQFSIAGLRRDLATIEARQAEAELEQKELRAGVAATSNSLRLEEEVRQRLGLVKAGEEKIYFVEEAP